MSTRTLRTRRRHGSRLIKVSRSEEGSRYTVGEETFTTYADLMRKVTGRDPTMCFARYFRIGKYDPRPPTAVSPLVMFRKRPGMPCVKVRKRGVDLSARYNEVVKLFYAGFAPKLRAAGYSEEELKECLQDVCLGIEIRNGRKGAWDPERCSFGYYIHLVANSVVTNHYNRRRRRQGREQVGVFSYGEDGEWGRCDAASANIMTLKPRSWVPPHVAAEDLAGYIRTREDSGRAAARLALKVLPYVSDGMRRGEIAKEIGASAARVGRSLKYLRDAAREWDGRGLR